MDGSQWLRLNKRYWMAMGRAMGRFSMASPGDKLRSQSRRQGQSLAAFTALSRTGSGPRSPTTSFAVTLEQGKIQTPPPSSALEDKIRAWAWSGSCAKTRRR